MDNHENLQTEPLKLEEQFFFKKAEFLQVPKPLS